MKAIMTQFRSLSLTAIVQANENQGAMGMPVASIWPVEKICGRAVTVNMAPEVNCLTDEQIAMLNPGDVLVVAADGFELSFLTERLQCLLKRQGVVALVTDGVVRNAQNYKTIQLPVFAKGVCDKMQKGTVPAKIGGEVICNGVLVGNGDVVFADCDGVAVIKAADVETVLKKAEEIEAQRQALLEEANKI